MNNIQFFPSEKALKIEVCIIHGFLCFRLAFTISMYKCNLCYLMLTKVNENIELGMHEVPAYGDKEACLFKVHLNLM